MRSRSSLLLSSSETSSPRTHPIVMNKIQRAIGRRPQSSSQGPELRCGFCPVCSSNKSGHCACAPVHSWGSLQTSDDAAVSGRVTGMTTSGRRELVRCQSVIPGDPFLFAQKESS